MKKIKEGKKIIYKCGKSQDLPKRENKPEKVKPVKIKKEAANPAESTKEVENNG